MPTTTLLVIDPQNDFCDLSPIAFNGSDATPGTPASPALPVPGANADMTRLAAFIQRNATRIDSVITTMDTHSPYDIGHSSYWIGADGSQPTPFYAITSEELLAKKWFPRDPTQKDWVTRYALAVEAQGFRGIEIWPEHCIGGTWGHAVHEEVMKALIAWSRGQGKAVNYVFKGLNPNTESYSAVEAVVPIFSDKSTQYNLALADQLGDSSLVIVAGEALSHCVASTMRSVLKEGRVKPSRVVMLTDCMSPVGGFENAATSFMSEMAEQGVRFANSANFNF